MTRPAEGVEARAFDEAAARLTAGLTEGDRVGRDDFRVVVQWLTRWLVRRFGLSEQDAEDAAVAAIEGMYEVGRADAAAPAIRKPVAYLVWAARNRAIDKLRRQTIVNAHERAELGPGVIDDDERVAALLERDASVSDVRSAMQAAAEAGDDLAVRVIGVWLNMASELGEEPGSRAVGERAGVSHTSVNQVLRRFRSYFPPDGAPSS
ncbi:MAG TPA: hypothetical protein VF712_09455 [Thermoleophilaceae bacterium]|jgi:DNA-directed RNA polymerase specialized sigma24 family protein